MITTPWSCSLSTQSTGEHVHTLAIMHIPHAHITIAAASRQSKHIYMYLCYETTNTHTCVCVHSHTIQCPSGRRVDVWPQNRSLLSSIRAAIYHSRMWWSCFSARRTLEYKYWNDGHDHRSTRKLTTLECWQNSPDAGRCHRINLIDRPPCRRMGICWPNTWR